MKIDEMVAKIMREQGEPREGLSPSQIKWLEEHRMTEEQIRAWLMGLGIYNG